MSYEKPVEELVLATDTEKIETGTDIQITIVPGYPSVENLNANLRKVLYDGENNVVLSVLNVNSLMDAISACEQEKKEDIQVGAIDCFTEENYELFHTKGYDSKEKLDYLVGMRDMPGIIGKMAVLFNCSNPSGQQHLRKSLTASMRCL
mgnify:CR=1 FL=1